jgi:hypothetical protein
VLLPCADGLALVCADAQGGDHQLHGERRHEDPGTTHLHYHLSSAKYCVSGPQKTKSCASMAADGARTDKHASRYIAVRTAERGSLSDSSRAHVKTKSALTKGRGSEGPNGRQDTRWSRNQNKGRYRYRDIIKARKDGHLRSPVAGRLQLQPLARHPFLSARSTRRHREADNWRAGLGRASGRWRPGTSVPDGRYERFVLSQCLIGSFALLLPAGLDVGPAQGHWPAR